MGLVQAVIICAVLRLATVESRPSPDVWLLRTPRETAKFNSFRDPAPFTFISWKISNITIVTTSTEFDNFTNPEYADRITLFSDGSLELRNVTLDDPGYYTLNITLTEGPQTNILFLLDVYERVSDVRVSASATDLIENQSSVNLTCSTTSGTDLKFSWYNRTHSLPFKTPVLTLTTVRRYDTGPFRCEAHNIGSRVVSEDVNLTVSYGPDVILKTVPSGDFYLEGSNVTLLCIVDSRPEASEITWSHNEGLLSFPGAQLELRHLTPEHGGIYHCEAFNHITRIYAASPPAVISVYRLATEAGLPDRVIVGIVIIFIAGFGSAVGYAFLHKRKRMIARASESIK